MSFLDPSTDASDPAALARCDEAAGLTLGPLARMLSLAAAAALLFAFAVFPRLVGPLDVHYMRADGYYDIATNLLSGSGFHVGLEPRVYDGYVRREPVYPLLLAASMLLPGFPASMVITQVIIFVATAWLAYLLYARFSARPALAIPAASIFALYPFSFWYVGKPTPENVTPLMIVAAFWCCHRYLETGHVSKAALWAAVCAAAVLTKSNLLIVLPVQFAIAFCFNEYRQQLLRHLPAIGLTFAFVMCPWVIRNYALSGRFIWGSSMGGPAFFMGNYANTLESVRQLGSGLKGEEEIGREWKKRYFEVRAADNGRAAHPAVLEAAVDARFAAEIRPWIAANKVAFVRKTAVGLGTTWFITSDWKKTLILLPFQVVMFGLAAVGVVAAFKERGLRLLEYQILAVIGVVYVSISMVYADARYTHVLLPLLAYYAAWAIGPDRWARVTRPFFRIGRGE